MADEKTIAGYQIIEQVGQGGVGRVYRARQPMLDRTVALKVLAPHLAGDAAYVARFQREAAAAAQLNHPGIVTVYAAGQQEGTHYIAMEFVEGETLHNRLDRHGRLEPAEAIAICVHLAEALRYAWDKARLVHRDIKPDNIFLSTTGEVKLGDLGLARRVGGDSTHVTQHGTAWGTPHYMSPEQARGERELDCRSDIYSLGCTLYRMLTGRTPYDGADAMAVMTKHVHEPPPAILKVLPTCPMPVVFLLNKMLAKNPAARPQTYDELLADLHRVHTQLAQPQAATPAAAPKPAEAAATKKPPVAIYAAAAVAALLVIAGLMFWPSSGKRGDAAPREDIPTAPSRQPEPPSPAPAPAPAAVVPAAPAPTPVGTPVPAATPAPTPVATPMTAPAPAAPRAATAPPVTVPAGPPPVDAAFIATVAALAPEAQVRAIIAKLKELNPAFDGLATSTIESNTLVALAFSTADAGDLTPLKAAPGLRSLVCAGTFEKQSLSNLDALAGLPLTNLNCSYSRVRDLAPLRGMPLVALDLRSSAVTNFTALAEMPLRHLCLDFVPDRDRDALWAIKSLETINTRVAAEFWHEVGPPQDEFAKAIAALPATQQVAQVAARLRELNPQFDGRVTHKIVGDKVTDLGFSTAAVTDISPVAALRTLQRLSLIPAGGTNATGLLADLSPLRALWLSALWCQNNPVSDLSPLRGQPLTVLSCGHTQVTDLAPLHGMPLTVLSCNNTDVSDLAPLAGAPLQMLWCQATKVTDLSLLTNMPLRELRCDFLRDRDGALLRAIPTLQRINGETAAMFWLRQDAPAPRPVGKAAARTVRAPTPATAAAGAGLTGKQMLERFKARLKEVNPGFSGAVEPVFEGDTLAGVTFTTEAVSDLSPVRDLAGLKSLRCVAAPGQGRVGRLAPLSGLPLQNLDCSGNRVTDLTPLKTTALTSLRLAGNPLSDLRGLEGLRLASLDCAHTAVAELAPLARLPLASLDLTGTKVASLAPLKGVPLTALNLANTAVSDLAPLRGMKLNSLILDSTPVGDLGPLRGMPLGVLSLAHTPVASIGPLKGMPLGSLNLAGTRVADLTPIRECPVGSLTLDGTLVSNLTPLHEMPLSFLSCIGTKVGDLTPLRDKALAVLRLNDTAVKDLAPLRRMPLTELWIQHTKVTDLSPLKTMPLQALKADIKPERDAAILRDIKTLATINDQPAAEFWKKAGTAP